jgi:carbamoyltransferase
MGLAPYGIPSSVETKKYVRLIKEHLIDIRPDGSFLLNMRHFNFATGLTMTKDRNWKKIFGISRREPEAAISQSHMNLALAIQMVTEEIVIQLARTAKKLSGSNHLTLAGGVALNSVANGKLLRENIFDNIWIQPAATDSGGSLGAALAAWHIYFNQNRSVTVQDNMKGAYLGPDYTSEEIEKMLINRNASFQRINEEEKLFDMTAKELESGKVVGWFQGRMEYGPRALGNRSILADARNPEMQKKLNLKIKKREGFRPFAPSVLEEDIKEFFEIRTSSPYMLHVVPVQEKHRKDLPTNYENLDLYEKLYIERSDIPAVTHIDFSARLQSVNKKTNPRFWSLLKAFKKLTGVGILINTSFNVRGEPIVCTPEDAFNCFMNTDMDVLVLSKYILRKEDQSEANNINMKFEAD